MDSKIACCMFFHLLGQLNAVDAALIGGFSYTELLPIILKHQIHVMLLPLVHRMEGSITGLMTKNE